MAEKFCQELATLMGVGGGSLGGLGEFEENVPVSN
jgi:hypothetical protein